MQVDSLSITGSAATDEFDFVVVALPHNHLPAVTFAENDSNAAMHDHFDLLQLSAHYLRITILFDQPFGEAFKIPIGCSTIRRDLLPLCEPSRGADSSTECWAGCLAERRPRR